MLTLWLLTVPSRSMKCQKVSSILQTVFYPLSVRSEVEREDLVQQQRIKVQEKVIERQKEHDKRLQQERGARMRAKRARGSGARLYLKLLIRDTMKPVTTLAKIQHVRRIKSHTYHRLFALRSVQCRGWHPL